MGHPGWPKHTHYNTPGMHFWAVLLPPPAMSQWSITTSETIYTCAEDYLKEACRTKIPGQCKVSFIVSDP